MFVQELRSANEPEGERPGPANDVRQAAALLAGPPAEQQRAERAAAAARRLEQRSPELFARPDVRFALAASQRASGLGGQADRYYLLTRRTRPRDSWWACAEMEAWLSAPPEGPAPKPLWTCPRVPSRPRLDGRLDDPPWQRALALDLRSGDGPEAGETVVLLAHDGQYLYLAASCRRAAGVPYPAAQGVRPRDAELHHRDRMELLLDVDRDWCTWLRLTIDHRGWTEESCWGDASWNPRWFVSAGGDTETWTCEAAIPLAALARGGAPAGAYWGLGVQRVVPGRGVASASAPAGLSPLPQGFGLVRFE
jgi:hypothetical protein